jgi:ATP synthase F1 complex assembly factor 2
MPLTTLSCTVLDQVCEQPHHYQNSVLRYLPTDTLLLWADPAVDPDLHSEQDRLWRPIHRRLERILGRPFPTTTADANVIIPSARHSNHGNGSAGSRPAGDPSLLQFCQEWVESLDAWHLGILYSLTVEAKSLGLALSYLHSSSQLDGAGDDDGDPIASSLLNGGEASSLRDVWVPACRVEEEVQIAQWGVVEGGHDYDRLNCSIQFHAAALMHMCLEVERQRTTVHPGPGLSTS